MRKLGCLGIVIILLLAVIVYEQWRIEQLRADVAAIASKIHAAKPSSATQPDLMTALAEAQKYTRRAYESLKGRNVNLAEARENLDKAASRLNSAQNASEDIVDTAARFLGKAKDNAVSVFKKAYKDMSEEPTQKPRVESQKSRASSAKPAGN